MMRSASEIRATPLSEMLGLAETVTDSPDVIGVFASCEFAELNDDGKLWVAAIVRETLAVAAEVRN